METDALCVSLQISLQFSKRLQTALNGMNVKGKAFLFSKWLSKYYIIFKENLKIVMQERTEEILFSIITNLIEIRTINFILYK